TMVAFDGDGRMLIAESGYGGAGTPKVSRVEPDGSRTTLAEGDPLEMPVTAVAVHAGTTYVVSAATVWRLADGGLEPIISGLAGLGDHQANQLAFADESLYLAIGTVTNSAVVGPDNAVFGWLEVPDRRDLHDVPCADITLAGEPFESEDPLGDADSVRTSAYSPFGTAHPAGSVVTGAVPCNGAILRAGLDGSGLELVAWGLRNPYGLEVGPDGALYATMHGFDARGSRPIEDAWDCFYRIEEGAWYGWPDFACDVPVTDGRFRPAGQPQPQFVLAEHPTDNPPAPIARFDPHAGTNGFAFSPGEPWGPPTDAFVALFGDFTPATGTVPAPQGVKVVRVDTRDGTVSDFIYNDIAGEASKHGLGGLEHPSDVTFGPDGAMYVTDWGIARISTDGLKLDPGSGVVWRVTPRTTAALLPVGSGILINLLIVVGLALLAVGALAGRQPGPSLLGGVIAGGLAGLAMGALMMFVIAPMLQLPWYAPPRVLATIPLGRVAVANILEFELISFVVGVLVLLVLTGLLGLVFALLARRPPGIRIVLGGLCYGLAVWAALQWFVLPATFPLVSDKGFPPVWYAVSFAAFGVVLGLLSLAFARRYRPG
ncbi:MAG TPA: hypothetical protein VNW68_00215, partial [Candidatus Limnocylindria bacterium]|nr:hypothetical protein [Candidatus Limnocylindria bacterium]